VTREGAACKAPPEARGRTLHTLLVLRHAKAAGEPGVNDLQRPLTGRGRRDAGAAGRWLLAQGIVPGRVICSPAQRTRETWACLSAALGTAAPGQRAVSFDRRVYDAGAQALLYLVAEQPEEAATVMTVGHNPASHELVVAFTGRRDVAFPTCALAVIRIGANWADTAPGDGELASLWSPPAAG
jgi:phosphohistidine phosphatase